MIDIKLQKSGFPVIIGGHEFWFDTRPEKIEDYANVEKTVSKRIKEIEEELINDSNENGAKDGLERIKGAIDLVKERIKLNYDTIFGDGTFDTLYNDFPDIQALANAWNEVEANISVKLEQIAEQKQRESTLKAIEYEARLNAKVNKEQENTSEEE